MGNGGEVLSFVVLLIINWARAFRILELGEKGSSSAEGRGKERQQAGSTGLLTPVPGCACQCTVAFSFLFSFSYLFLRHLQKGKAIGV